MRISPKTEHAHLLRELVQWRYHELDDALGPACAETETASPNHRAALGMFLSGHVQEAAGGVLALTLAHPHGAHLKRHGTTRTRFVAGFELLLSHAPHTSKIYLTRCACGPTAPAWVWLVEPNMDAYTRALAVAVAMLDESSSWEERAKYAGLGAMALRTARHKLRAWEVV